MFEKEAEENKPPYAYCTLDTNCELWKDGYQKGAEFGYNKAKEEMQAQIEKLKCCENCKHHCFRGNELNCRTLPYDEELKCMETKEHWEIKENVR